MRTMSAITPAPSPRSNVNPLSAPQKALRKLGLVRDIDLALHLPLRYEDETRIVSLRDVREGDEVQIEAVVTASEVSFRPRRQLLPRRLLLRLLRQQRPPLPRRHPCPTKATPPG